MFTDRLTMPEREALVVLLAFIAATDGEVRSEEREFIQNRCAQLDISGDPFERIGDASMSALCETFQTQETRRAALIELMQAALIDHEYHSSEARSIRVIAKLMAVEEQTVDALEAWVQQGIEWKKAGENLLRTK